MPLTEDSDIAKVTTNAIGVLIGVTMKSYLVVENTEFTYMVKMLESCYNVSSHVHFRQSVVPAVYKQEQAAVVLQLSAGQSLMMEHY